MIKYNRQSENRNVVLIHEIANHASQEALLLAIPSLFFEAAVMVERV